MRWRGLIPRREQRATGATGANGEKRVWRSALLGVVLAMLLATSGSALLRPGDATAQRSGPPFARVLVVGDSISAGWFASTRAASYPERLVALLHAANPANGTWSRVIAVPGMQAGGGVRELRKLPTIPRADLIVVEFGTNDYDNHPVPPAAFATSYATVLDLLMGASPNATVVCVLVWGAAGHPNVFGASPETYNGLIEQACRNLPHPGIPVDITSLYSYAAYHGPTGHPSFANSHTDAFHPNDAGQDAIARAIFAALPEG